MAFKNYRKYHCSSVKVSTLMILISFTATNTETVDSFKVLNHKTNVPPGQSLKVHGSKGGGSMRRRRKWPSREVGKIQMKAWQCFHKMIPVGATNILNSSQLRVESVMSHDEEDPHPEFSIL